MNAAAWTSTVTGIGFLGLVGLDIYRTILHSRGRSGSVTEALTRAVWRLTRGAAFRRSRQGRHRLLNHVGPLLLPGIVATLVALLILGYALLYWPHLPADFNVQEKAQSSRSIEALYFSGITFTTLGYGDIAPRSTPMRLLALTSVAAAERNFMRATFGPFAFDFCSTAYALTVFSIFMTENKSVPRSGNFSFFHT